MRQIANLDRRVKIFLWTPNRVKVLYEDYKIYGPYLRKDKRLHINLVNKDKDKRLTVSYPKFLMEQHLQRYLTEDETVDHIDRDFSNNSLENLEIRLRVDHSAIDAKRRHSESFICPMCKISFILTSQKVNDAYQNRLKGKTGPYCSRSCAGKVRDKSKFPINEVPVRHFYLEK